MELILGQPLGLWALIGIPIVLLIHMLQHEARRHKISTMFLVELVQMDGKEGRVLDRIRNSSQLWLHLLAVLLLTWILVQPRWLKNDSFQRVIVVLDESASMSAFRAEVESALRKTLPAFLNLAAFTEWTLLPSSPESMTLYSGGELDELFASLDGWEPVRGEHDMEPVLTVAQHLAKQSGVVILVSDHLHDERWIGIQQVAVGRPLSNCGFTGLRVSEDGAKATWQAVVRNHSEETVHRDWWVESEGQASTSRSFSLGGAETKTLYGTFPATSSFSIQLSQDEFTLDDVMPVVRPRAKRIELDVAVRGGLKPIVQKVVATLNHVTPVLRGRTPDVEFLSFRAPAIPGPRTHAVCLSEELGDKGRDANGMILAEDHPLVKDLAWRGLLVQRIANLQRQEDDDVLVWHGDAPLIFLRTSGDIRQLIFGFDVLHSNAAQQPAFVLLIHRFIESIRHEKRGLASDNVELGQRLPLSVGQQTDDLIITDANRLDDKPTTLPAERAYLFRAPDRPTRFQVVQGRDVLFVGAAHFADVREADFRDCATGWELEKVLQRVEVHNSKPDPMVPLWMVLVGGVLVWSWFEGGRRG